jgi:hypothetical protein
MACGDTGESPQLVAIPTATWQTEFTFLTEFILEENSMFNKNDKQ